MNNLRILPSIKTSPRGVVLLLSSRTPRAAASRIFLLFPEGKQWTKPPFSRFSRTLTGALSFTGEASVAANPSSGPVGAGLGNSQGSGRNAAVAPPSGGEITRDNCCNREASTLVLFSIGQMWYLHAIVTCPR